MIQTAIAKSSRKLGNPSGHHPGQNRKSACDLFTAEYEINDIRPAARNILTKGQTQDEIGRDSGASLSTRGRFLSVAEKRSGAPINDRSLYLFIQGNTKDSVDLAVQKIEDIIQMDGNQGPYRGPPRSSHNNSVTTMNHVSMPPPAQMTMPPPIVSGGMAITSTTNTPINSTCVEKIFIGLDYAPPSFDLRSRLIGTGGANLNYIRTETGAMATLRGRGSLFVDPGLATESPEPIHLYIEHLRYEGLQAAKQLARNLIETLQQELAQFQQMNPPMASLHYSAQTTVVQQPHIYTQHTMTHPPPQNIMAMPPPQPTLVHHQLQPLQIHPHGAQGLVQIQPPPGLPIPIKTLVPASAGPPHLSHPPPSLQHLQQQCQPATQIVVNQSLPIPIKTMVPLQAPQPNYQYQYIHTTGQDAPQPAAGPSGAVTIQHIYQSAHPSMPPQHVQSIMQQQPSSTTFSDVTTTTFAQQMIRPPQGPPQQQYITVQQGGNTAYMVPPPNLIQTTAQVPTTTIIYSSHPPPQLMQQPPNYSMAQAIHATTHQMITADVKLEEKQDECGVGKLDDFTEGQQRSMAQSIVSTMTAPPPIMSVPPPTVQHMMGNSYATTPMHAQTHMYGQVPMSQAPGQPQQQFLINHSHPGLHGPPLEYRSGSGGTTYQQIQHPIMTAATSMEMPVQYPQMPPQMKMNHQVPPPPFTSQGPGNGMQAGPPPQPVPFPMQQQQQESQNMIRSGQKRKLVDDGGDNGSNMNQKNNGHGDPMNLPNNRHIRMPSGGAPFGSQQQLEYVATSSAAGRVNAMTGGAPITSNTNSNDLNQDTYTAQGHRLDDRNHSVNQMSMPGEIGDHPHQSNCGLPIDAPPVEESQYDGHPASVKSGGPLMSMVRCNIMGKPPPQLPSSHMGALRGVESSTSIMANSAAQQQQMQRYNNQW